MPRSESRSSGETSCSFDLATAQRSWGSRSSSSACGSKIPPGSPAKRRPLAPGSQSRSSSAGSNAGRRPNRRRVIGSCFIVAASAAILALADDPHGGEELRHVLAGTDPVRLVGRYRLVPADLRTGRRALARASGRALGHRILRSLRFRDHCVGPARRDLRGVREPYSSRPRLALRCAVHPSESPRERSGRRGRERRSSRSRRTSRPDPFSSCASRPARRRHACSAVTSALQARKLWAQTSAGSSAILARRLIILNAPTRDIPRSWSASRRPGSQLRKRGPRRSSPIRAASR